MKTALVHFNHSEDLHHTGWADMRSSEWKPNYGDMLVCASILKQLEMGPPVRLNFGESLNEPVELAIVRGSTYLHNEFNFADANSTLDSIDAPLAVIGLGAQNPVKDIGFLDGNAGARDFIARLNEKSASISVRGAFTAAVVERLGGRNIRVTGCPSMFYVGVAPRVRVPELLGRPERSLGISIHSGLGPNIFCHAPEAALSMHGKLIRWAIDNAVNVSLFEQGVMTEFNVADRELPFAERLEAAVTVRSHMRADALFSPERLMAHMVSVKSIEEWLAKARDLDALLGFRFHGNMVGLLQGKPCYYHVYDSRLTEFCELYKLPWQDVTEPWLDPCQAIIDHDWDATNAQLTRCYAEVHAFYVENGFQTTLKDPAALATVI